LIIKEQHIIRKSMKICFGIFTLLILILFLVAGIKSYVDKKKFQTKVIENTSIISQIEGKDQIKEAEEETKISIPNEILASTGMTELEVRELVNHMFDENGSITREGEEFKEIIEKTIVENNEYITYEEVEDHSSEIEDMMRELAGIQQKNDSLDGKIDTTEDSFSAIVDEMKKNLKDSMEEKNKETSERMDSIEKEFGSKTDLMKNDIDNIVNNLYEELNTKIDENNTTTNDRFTLLENNVYLNNESFLTFQTAVYERTDELYSMIDELSAEEVSYDKTRSSDSVNADNVQDAIDKLGKSVGDGKKLLADAITAKGGRVAENPTFEELKQAIIDIPNEITIEKAVENTGATIKYHYHYHDGNDQDGGGCYEWQQTGTYQQPHTGSHDIRCEKADGNDRYYVYCTGCSADYMTGRISEHDYDSSYARSQFYNRHGYSHTSYTTEPVYGYVLICGKLDGQIIGAEIVYE